VFRFDLRIGAYPEAVISTDADRVGGCSVVSDIFPEEFPVVTEGKPPVVGLNNFGSSTIPVELN